jgi:RND family efflux transporter MFP subunit
LIYFELGEEKVRKFSFLSMAVCLGVLLLLVAGCGQTEGPPQEEKTVPVEVAAVVKTDLSREIEVTGEVIPAAEVNIAPQITGVARVASINAKVGQSVNRGTVLFELDRTDFENGLRNAEAALYIAETNLEAAEKAYQRAKDLFEANAMSQAEYEGAETGYKIARAQYDQAEVARDTAQKNLVEATVTAPVSGRVAYLDVEVGEMVGPQAPVAGVVRLNPVRVKLNLSENVVGSVAVGQEVGVTVDAAGKTAAGTVCSVAPKIDRTTRAFPVEVEIPNSDGKILAGMVAKIRLATGASKGALVVPAAAVLKSSGESMVFVVKDGVVEERAVTTGFSSKDRVEVLTGLSESEEVIVTGNRLVGDGQKVRVDKTVDSTGGDDR